ncbi:general substrate transporter [Neocallimastix lanati (nom. inval.)]|nr:general substrate transporter [Neocallimastix sp. JGI-2020a]
MGKYMNKRLLFYTVINSVGAFIFGWETTMLNILFSMRASFGAKFGLYTFDPKRHFWAESEDKHLREMIITPSFTFGGIFGVILNLYLMDSIGRTKSLRIGSIIYFIGSCLQVFGNSIVTFIIGRAISGAASGIALSLCNIYLAEISPKQIRGTTGIACALGLKGGMFISALFETLCLKLITKNMTAQWRVAVGGLLVPSTLFLIFVWFLPESPRYLLLKRKDEKALNNLAHIRQKETTDPSILAEFRGISMGVKKQLAHGIISWKALFNTKSVLYRLIVSIVLQLLHQFVGISVIGFYSTQIYSKYLGLSLQQYGAWLNTLSQFISFILAIPAIHFVEKVGRRLLFIWGAIILGICMFAIYGLCHIVDATGIKAFGWICVGFIYLFNIAYSWTWASVVYVWQAEVFPIRMRAKATTIGNIFHHIAGMLVSSTTTTIMKYISYYTFIIYGVFCLLGALFSYLCVKETKGIPLEEMDYLYGGGNSQPKVPTEDIQKKIEDDKNVVKKMERDITEA